VETWMGICHGWAPASYMLARPRRTLSLKSPDGVLIRFFPSDVKALASLLRTLRNVDGVFDAYRVTPN